MAIAASILDGQATVEFVLGGGKRLSSVTVQNLSLKDVRLTLWRDGARDATLILPAGTARFTRSFPTTYSLDATGAGLSLGVA